MSIKLKKHHFCQIEMQHLFAIAASYLDGKSKQSCWFRTHAGDTAIEYTTKSNGCAKTFRSGLLHSIRGRPAIVKNNGDKYWYFEGKLHRSLEPAVELKSGDKGFYIYGVKQRIEYADGRIFEYYENGTVLHIFVLPKHQRVNVHESADKILLFKLSRQKDVSLPFEFESWFRHGEYHRDDDLPAVIFYNGAKFWYKHGKMHRSGGPAVELRSGTKLWYCRGSLHRESDLPAVELVDGSKAWYFRGLLHRDFDLPAIVKVDGTQKWYKHNKCHRENGPAIVKADGNQLWVVNGIKQKLVRPDGTITIFNTTNQPSQYGLDKPGSNVSYIVKINPMLF